MFTHRPLPRSLKLGSLLLAVLLGACASQPDRRGPPEGENRPDRSERSKPSGRTDGTFIKPIGLLFSEFDTDRDRSISSFELERGLDTKWGDLSSSGSVSAITYNNWARRALGSIDAQPTLMTLDRDFNGVLSKAEFMGGYLREYKRLDKDANGQLTRAEMIVQVMAPEGRTQEKSKSRGGKGDSGRGGRPPKR